MDWDYTDYYGYEKNSKLNLTYYSNARGLKYFLRFLKNNNCYASFVTILQKQQLLKHMKMQILFSRDLSIDLRYVFSLYCYRDLLKALHEDADYWKKVDLKWKSEFDKWYNCGYSKCIRTYDNIFDYE